MLEALHIKNLGPAAEMRLELTPRLNLITGDNGLGKSFLLDVSWWALTRTWARGAAIPAPSQRAVISYSYNKKTGGSYQHESVFNPKTESWPVKSARPAIPGLILYAQVDGGFAVWDPARNYWQDRDSDIRRPSAFLFAPHEVWEGNALCEGLIRDWASWQREQGEAFDILKEILRTLSPPGELLSPGELRKLTVDDPRRHPTIKTAYDQEVPLVHASAGVRRIVALTYLLVWAWLEHTAAAKLRGEEPAGEIIFLIDEVEAHLHPKWQRRIVPALLQVMSALVQKKSARIQLITATHSPLVLASAEPLFDDSRDAWFDLDIKDKAVTLQRRPFIRRGDVSKWLTSEAFDLGEPRSLEAEQAIQRALALARQGHATAAELRAVDDALSATLHDTDRFWLRWSAGKENLIAQDKTANAAHQESPKA